jgi:hypothetical protein
VTGIVELVDVCDRQCANDLGWFEVLGSWARDEDEPAFQRWCADAARRLAWHAELWAGRRPRIPPESSPELPAPARPDISGDRRRACREMLDRMRADVAAVAADTDPDLDPATMRVVGLVDADLAELRARLH